jgi:hypothetical protein
VKTGLKKTILLCLAALMLLGVSQVQRSLNVDRDRLGFTRVAPLENAPPVLAFTTVALGGFRGIISNILWMRATELQDDDKFFEMKQLADWITKLEPHFVQVWLMQAWNMAYNISVKFKDWPDRWRWVRGGIELLRDEGLRYNPNEMLIYRELGWIFQHKLGQNLDDASLYYKQQWADEMAAMFDKKTPNLDELANPQTPDQKRRADLLRSKYKMDPNVMKTVDELYGPLEWRLPESSAIYWAYLGLQAAQRNPTKINKEDLITLRRMIYQSMLLSFKRGRLIANPFAKSFDFGPNLEIIPKVSFAYEKAVEDEPGMRDHIQNAHRNFLKDAVYYLYTNNRIKEAGEWYRYLATKYPNKPVLDGKPDSFPSTLTLDQFAIERMKENAKSFLGKDEAQMAIEGLLQHAYLALVTDQDNEYTGYKLLAKKFWDSHMSEVPKERGGAIGLRAFAEIDHEVLNRLLDTKQGLVPEARAVLRSKLGMPAETAPQPAAGTNSAPVKLTSIK